MYIYTENFVSSLISVLRMANDLSTNDIYDLFVVSETCLVHHLLMVLKSDTVISISEFSILYLKLTQHAYACHGCKMIISDERFHNFSFFYLKIDCGYMLEQPH